MFKYYGRTESGKHNEKEARNKRGQTPSLWSQKNGLKDVHTKKKRLNIICSDAEGIVKANLFSFAPGIGIDAKSYWQKQEIIFKS